MKKLTSLVLALCFCACAQVPKESVELSTAVGKDIAEAHQSHLQLAHLLFDRMKEDVNRFVDTVYAPHQLDFAFQAQVAKAASADAKPSNSMLLLIDKAFSSEGTSDQRDAVITVMTKFSTAVRADVEDYRRRLLKPIRTQENKVIGSIDRHYQKMHYGNSIVTGHLSSIAKVHEVQGELLSAIGVDADLRTQMGDQLAKTSETLKEYVDEAEKVPGKIDETQAKIEGLLGVEN